MTAVVIAAAVAFAVGVTGIFVGVFDATGERRVAAWAGVDGDSGVPSTQSWVSRAGRSGVALATGLIVAGVTRWPVAGIFSALATASLPGILRRSDPSAAVRRPEAVAGWTELLRDSLVASSGLAQAVVAVAPSAPVEIRPQASAMAARLVNGVPFERALRSFAVELDDPSADFVVCALLLAASSRAQRLADVLGALAASIREDVAMRLRVEAARASARSGVRTIVLFSIGFAGVLSVVARSYLAPFGTAEGQVVLVAVGLFYAGGLGLMVRMVRPTPSSRLVRLEHVE